MTSSDHSFVYDFRSIPEMLEHARLTWPDREAFRQFDYGSNVWVSTTWSQYHARVQAWRRAFQAMGLEKGERVAMLLTNSLDAVTFDSAALSNGLVPVPLHAIDTPGACAYILKDSNARFLVTTARARWNAIAAAGTPLPDLKQVVLLNETESPEFDGTLPRVDAARVWLARGEAVTDEELPAFPGWDALAGLIYTSGTTGRPKGVMLSHGNIVSNVQQISRVCDVCEEDVYLSYLPFSHTFERTVAHYTAMAHGASLAFARSVANLEHDLIEVRPTLLCSVPRVYERIYQKIQTELARGSDRDRYLTDWMLEVGWRRFAKKNDLPVESTPRMCLDDEVHPILDREVARKIRKMFGGRLRATFAGGASLNYTVAKFFSAMGLNIQQVYGLTETSPILSWSTPEGNHPDTVGLPAPGTEARLGENDELQVKGPQVMQGYWNRPEDTKAAFTEDGWFRTGDQADLSDGGRVRIKGRIKEIIVTSTGEKIAPVDVEFAMQSDRLFEQALVIGEKRPFVAALVVVNDAEWHDLCAGLQLDPEDPATLVSRDAQRAVIRRIRAATKTFPQYGVPRAVGILRTPWTVENELLTSTMKLKRRTICERFSTLIDQMYAEINA